MTGRSALLPLSVRLGRWLEASAIAWLLLAIALCGKAQSKRQKSKTNGQRQRPQAKSDLARRADAAANSKAHDSRPRLFRSAARPRHFVGIMPDQHLPDIERE